MPGVGVYKNGNTNTGGAKLLDERAQSLTVLIQIPPMIGGLLEGVIGHQGCLGRTDFQNQIHKGRFHGIAFYIQFRTQRLSKNPNIIGPYVAGIRPWMNRDAIGPKSFAIQGKLERIGHAVVSAITQQRYFVDVNTEAGQSEKLSPQAQDRAAFGLLK